MGAGGGQLVRARAAGRDGDADHAAVESGRHVVLGVADHQNVGVRERPVRRLGPGSRRPDQLRAELMIITVAAEPGVQPTVESHVGHLRDGDRSDVPGDQRLHHVVARVQRSQDLADAGQRDGRSRTGRQGRDLRRTPGEEGFVLDDSPGCRGGPRLRAETPESGTFTAQRGTFETLIVVDTDLDVVRAINRGTDAGLTVRGRAEHGRLGGAIYVEWPDGRPAVVTIFDGELPAAARSQTSSICCRAEDSRCRCTRSTSASPVRWPDLRMCRRWPVGSDPTVRIRT